MKKFINILKTDIKLILSDWKTLILILIMPLLLILYFSYIVNPIMSKSMAIEPFDIGVIDNENSILSRILIGQLEDIKLIKNAYVINENEANELIMENTISAAIIIPDGFTSSITTGENISITVLGNPNKESQSLIVKELITSASEIVSSGQGVLYSYYHFLNETSIDNNTLNTEFDELSKQIILKSLNRKNIISKISTYPNSSVTTFEYYTSSLLALFLMFAAMPILKILVLERTAGITTRLRTTNTKSILIILSKIALTFILCSMQFMVIVIGTSTFINNYWGAPLSSILLIFIVSIFAVSCWTVLLATLVNSQKSAIVFGNLGILLMSILGGTIYPINKMPDILKPLRFLTLNNWIHEGFIKIFSGNAVVDISKEVIALTGLGVMFLIISVISYKLKKVGVYDSIS